MDFRMVSSFQPVCGQSTPVNFVMFSLIFCSSWDWSWNYTTAASELLTHWLWMRRTQNKKIKKWKRQGLKDIKFCPTCSPFSLFSTLSWIIFGSLHISHWADSCSWWRAAVQTDDLFWGRLVPSISVVSVLGWWFILRRGRLKNLVSIGACWLGCDWLSLPWWSTRWRVSSLMANQSCACASGS